MRYTNANTKEQRSQSKRFRSLAATGRPSKLYKYRSIINTISSRNFGVSFDVTYLPNGRFWRLKYQHLQNLLLHSTIKMAHTHGQASGTAHAIYVCLLSCNCRSQQRVPTVITPVMAMDRQPALCTERSLSRSAVCRAAGGLRPFTAGQQGSLIGQ